MHSLPESLIASSPGTQPPEREARDREQHEDLIIQGKIITDLPNHLDIHKSV